MLENRFMYMALLQAGLFITLEIGTRKNILKNDLIMRLLKSIAIVLVVFSVYIASCK